MMEENSECKDCKTWEERLYWKHFNSMHFCVTLPSDFHHHLKLPEKFSAHMKAQLPNEVSLKGPSGVVWKIGLLKSDDLFFGGDEWNGFVKANDLKENCLLVFTYKRNSKFEVLIFDQGSSCEKESAYFVKKCRHTESGNEVTKKRTVREKASSTEIIEDDDEENSEHVATKKSRRDDEAVFNSGGQLKTSTPRKRVSNVAAKSRGRPKRVVLPRKSPNKPEVLSRKNPVRNAPTDEQRDMIDMITPERGEISPDNDHGHELKSQSNMSKEPKQILRERNTPQNGKLSPAEDHSVMKKGQSEKPLGNNAPKEPRGNNPTGIGESFQAADVSQNLEAKSEKRPRKHVTSKEPSQIADKELNTPEKGEYTPVTDFSQSENESVGRGPAKMIRPNYRESSLEDDRPFNSRRKRGRGRGRGQPRMQVHPKSTKKLVFSSETVSENRRFSKEYTSNRRPVTETETDYTFQRACQNLTEDSFTAIMRPSNVYRRFFLTVPANWLQKHLPSRNQEVILRVDDKTWHTTLFNNGKHSAGFSTGWKKFVLENCLEEFDVLVFTLVSQNDDGAVVMDVDIFRVVEKIVPVVPVTSQAN